MGLEVNRPLVWGFILIWLGVLLCLTFAVAILFWYSLLTLGFHKYSSSEFASCSSFCWNPVLLHCSVVVVLVRYGRVGVSYKLMIKSQSFSEFNLPVSLDCDLHRCFLAFLFPFRWDRKAHRGWSGRNIPHLAGMKLWPSFSCSVFPSYGEWSGHISQK